MAKDSNGRLKPFTVRFTRDNMRRLHNYTMRLSEERGVRVSYSQALGTLVEGMDKGKRKRASSAKR